MGTSPLQRKTALESGGSHGPMTLSELRQIQICRGAAIVAFGSLICVHLRNLWMATISLLWLRLRRAVPICEICGLLIPAHWMVTSTQGILRDTQGLTAFSTSRPALRRSASLKDGPINCRLVTGTPSYKSGIGMAMAGLRPRLT